MNIGDKFRRLLRWWNTMDSSDCVTDEEVTDGGPGSGNWGHHGRPGKRGGSAKGTGSRQFRSGSKEDGYKRNEEAREMRKKGLKQIQGPERKKTGKSRETVPVSFKDKEGKTRFTETKRDVENSFRDANLGTEALQSKVEALKEAAVQSNECKSALWKNANRYSYLEDTPMTWRARLSDRENEALEAIEQEAEESRDFLWWDHNPEKNRLMMQLSAKALGANIGEIEIPDEIVKKEPEREESPGQLSMFLNENVGENGSVTSNNTGRAEGSKWSKAALEAKEDEIAQERWTDYVVRHSLGNTKWSFTGALRNLGGAPGNIHNKNDPYIAYLDNHRDFAQKLEKMWDDQTDKNIRDQERLKKKKSTKQQMEELNKRTSKKKAEQPQSSEPEMTGEESETSLEDLFGDLWNETPEQRQERERKENEEQQKKDEEKKNRSAFGQNGVLESEYPDDLKLSKKERQFLDETVATYFDENRPKTKKKSNMPLVDEMYRAANGRPPMENLDFDRQKAQNELKKAEDVIAQRVLEGYKGLSREESAKKWQALKHELAQAGDDEIGPLLAAFQIGENGIQHWRIQRNKAKRTLEACDFIEKLRRRAEFAKSKSG